MKKIILKIFLLIITVLSFVSQKFLSETESPNFISFLNIYSKDESTYCATRASSQYLTEAKNLPPLPLSGRSLSQIVHVLIPGELIRIKVSNSLGKSPLEIKEAGLANNKAQGTGEIEVSTITKLNFGGEESVTIPAGQDSYYDTFNYALTALSEVAITIYF